MSEPKTPQPRIGKNAVPYCAQEDCAAYDGKRCEILGCRPDGICEPAVIGMYAAIRSRASEGNGTSLAQMAATIAAGLVTGSHRFASVAGTADFSVRLARAILEMTKDGE